MELLGSCRTVHHLIFRPSVPSAWRTREASDHSKRNISCSSSSSSTPSASIPSLRAISALPQLTSLDIDGVAVADADLNPLLVLAPGLTSLTLRGWAPTSGGTPPANSLAAATALLLGPLAQLRRLAALHVNLPPPSRSTAAASIHGAAAASAAEPARLLRELAAAAVQLPQLSSLAVTGIPEALLADARSRLVDGLAAPCLAHVALSSDSGWGAEWGRAREAVAPLAPRTARAAVRLPALTAAPAPAAGELRRALDAALRARGLAGMLPHLSSLALSLPPASAQPEVLAPVLAALPKLTDLKLTVLASSWLPADLHGLATAAAAAPHVTSLQLTPGLGRCVLGRGTLLPLAAAPAARGLVHLKLVGSFEVAASCGGGDADAAWAALARLPALRTLSVHHLAGAGSRRVQLPVSCLPASTLHTLHLRGVQVTPRLPVEGDVGSAAVAALAPPPPACSLEHLSLVGCHVAAGAVAGLASSGLERLVVAGSSVKGGWAAAAAAWPALEALSVGCGGGGSAGDHGGSGGRRTSERGGCSGGGRISGASGGASGAGHHAHSGPERLSLHCPEQLAELAGFSRLRRLDVQHLPELDGAGLRELLLLARQLSCLALSARRCSIALDELGAAVAGATGLQLQHVRLALPAALAPCHLEGAAAAGRGGGGGGGGAQALAAAWDSHRACAAAAAGACLARRLLDVVPWGAAIVVFNQVAEGRTRPGECHSTPAAA